jgi:hypothetical protein
MRDGRATWSEPLEESRERGRREREALPAAVRTLDAAPYAVRVDPTLDVLREQLTAGARQVTSLS